MRSAPCVGRKVPHKKKWLTLRELTGNPYHFTAAEIRAGQNDGVLVERVTGEYQCCEATYLMEWLTRPKRLDVDGLGRTS
jgi:hypothetical protein